MRKLSIKTKVCIVCNKPFDIISQKYNGKLKYSLSPYNKSICSLSCVNIKNKQRAKEQAERKKKEIVKKICRYCGKEVISTAYCPQSFCGGKYGECFRLFNSENRKGKYNPAYRNGFAVAGSRKYTGIHLRTCAKYRKKFKEKNDYLFCEICGVNSNGTPKFEVHHIYFASLFPKHKELHNQKNLILLCIQCHNDMHSGKMRSEVFNKIEKERGLKELFNNK